MKNKSGVVAIIGVVFIGLFALLSGLVTGTLFGPKAVAKHQYSEPTEMK